MISVQLLILILINTIFFLVLLLNSILSNEASKYQSIVKADTAILGIAFTQYAVTFVLENSDVLEKDSTEFAQQLRYIDWILTTPLLLYTYWKLAEVEGYNGDFGLLVIADIFMIVFGILAEVIFQNKPIAIWFYILGCLAFVVIIIKIIDIMNFFSKSKMSSRKNLGWFFIFGWLIYPLGYFFNDNIKYILYSIADLINKGVYSLFLYDILE
jgi:bacteriorhodopsin